MQNHKVFKDLIDFLACEWPEIYVNKDMYCSVLLKVYFKTITALVL